MGGELLLGLCCNTTPNSGFLHLRHILRCIIWVHISSVNDPWWRNNAVPRAVLDAVLRIYMTLSRQHRGQDLIHSNLNDRASLPVSFHCTLQQLVHSLTPGRDARAFVSCHRKRRKSCTSVSRPFSVNIFIPLLPLSPLSLLFFFHIRILYLRTNHTRDRLVYARRCTSEIALIEKPSGSSKSETRPPNQKE